MIECSWSWGASGSASCGPSRSSTSSATSGVASLGAPLGVPRGVPLVRGVLLLVLVEGLSTPPVKEMKP